MQTNSVLLVDIGNTRIKYRLLNDDADNVTTVDDLSALITYIEAAREIIAKDGVVGLFGRGLTTKLISNGIQGAMFSVLWKTIEPMLFPKE